MTETAFDYYTEDANATFSSNEQKWVNRIHKLKEQYPDEVEIVLEPEKNGGYIYARVPRTWLRVSPPVKRNLTDEQKAALCERLQKARASQGLGS